MDEEIFEAEYDGSLGTPPGLIAQNDQELAEVFDCLKEAKQYIVMVAKEPDDEGTGMSFFFVSHGNFIEVANFLHLTHSVYHDKLGEMIQAMIPEGQRYISYLARGGRIVSPTTLFKDEDDED